MYDYALSLTYTHRKPCSLKGINRILARKILPDKCRNLKRVPGDKVGNVSNKRCGNLGEDGIDQEILQATVSLNRSRLRSETGLY